jgi:hydrogenase maturation protease
MKASALILGLGNPILSDDGIGIALAQRLEDRLPGIDVATTAMVSLDLLDLISGYRQLFIIDALTCPGGCPGTLHRLTPECGTLHLCSSHGINFYEIIELGRQLDKPIPEVNLFGIEIAEEIPFGEQLSDAMAERLEENLAEIEREIRAYIKT